MSHSVMRGLPGQVAIGINEFDGCADQVGYDGVELCIDPLLEAVAQRTLNGFIGVFVGYPFGSHRRQGFQYSSW